MTRKRTPRVTPPTVPTEPPEELQDGEEVTLDPKTSNGTQGFNFLLGRLRMNVERKREFVARHMAELADMEAKLVHTCPHVNVTRTLTTPTTTDFYNQQARAYKVTCDLCGFSVVRE